MVKGFLAVYIRELLIMRSKGIKMIISMAIAPALYVVAFGYGIGKNVEIHGVPYIRFLLPGIIAMNSMTQAFNISSEINITRFYWKVFEEFQASPLNDFTYVIAEVITGITKALISIFLIIFIGILAGVKLNYNIFFWLGIILNAYIFSSIAVFAAMNVKSHADQAMLSNFIIFPMAFLGGTLFPLKNLPLWAQYILKFLPISIASKEIRGAAIFNENNFYSFVYLFVLGSIFLYLAYTSVKKARD
jgi:ABC-type multidrug transport system permease subunit